MINNLDTIPDDFLSKERGVTDCHVHIFGSSCNETSPRYPHPEQAASLADVEQIGSALGVDRYVLTQPSFLGFDNSVIMNALTERPNNLRGVVWLDQSHDPNLLSSMADQGVAGLRFPMFFSKQLPDWNAYSELFDAAAQCNIHIELGLSGNDLISSLDKILSHDVRIVLAHLGMFDKGVGPDKDPAFDTVLAAAQTGRVWIKLSSPYRTNETFVDRACYRLLDVFGAERIVWGSDSPHVSQSLIDNPYNHKSIYQNSFNWLNRVAGDDVTRRQILIKSPKELYGFPSINETKNSA